MYSKAADGAAGMGISCEEAIGGSVRRRAAGVGEYKEAVPFVPCWGYGEADRKTWRRPVAGRGAEIG
jgi:hypothetical protein